MVVSSKTDLRFPESGQQGHGARIIHRVQTSHYLGVEDHGPHFDLNLDEGRAINAEELIVRAGSLALRINKSNWKMTYERDAKVMETSCIKSVLIPV